MMQNKLKKISILAILLMCFSWQIKAEEITIPVIDINRLSGTWLEVARTPNFLQRSCDYAAINYRVSEEENILITKLCFTNRGVVQKRELAASVVRDKKRQSNKGKQLLFVEYTGIMRFFTPFSRANLMIFYVNKDYTETIIGNPDKSSFWILTRDIASVEQKQKLLEIAESFGLKNNNLIFNNFDKDSRDKIFAIFENR
ncbi:MAG: lipocalin family protein [Alphaproteobacteria bacterium]|jgi:apolipoprotein D and lipocalin family protein|nr:lipocalin family protein [Alphaproteobacteria bacterium]